MTLTVLTLIISKGANKEDDNIAIHEIHLYIGLDLKKKLPDKSRYV